MSDLISREDVWDMIAKLHSGYITIEQEQILERLAEMVDELPTAESEAYHLGWKEGREAEKER